MFTPPKVWQGWSLTPLRKGTGSGSGSGPDSNGSNRREGGTAVKAKGVASSEMVTPVPGRLSENGIRYDNSETLVEKVSQLEKELFEYQYNMGLLLIEKKEWTSKYEEIKRELEEANESLKRERATHLIAVSDVENREEGLRKALGVEKQCVLDLEKALHELRSENAEIKFTADSKLAEANALVTSVEEKSLEVEAKMRATDAKLAEASRKSSEVERKSKEVESREGSLQRERLSFIAEREALEATLSKQREDLREWERKLQEGEDRVAKGQLIVKQREERANENDRIIKQKEKDLEEAQKKIDAGNIALKEKEDDIYFRLKDLALREQESDALRKSLETKEEELLALQEKLDAREKAAVQHLIDEHQARLDTKQREFELEMDQRRKSVADSLKGKIAEVEKREAEVNHLEQKITKREQTLDKKLEKFKEKEKDFESKLKSLNEREKAFKTQENALEKEKKKLHVDKENLLNLQAEIEKVRTENEAQIQKINEQKDVLRVTEEERAEHLRLKSELKDQIEKCRSQQAVLMKEAEDLKSQKESFEKEWEELDVRKSEIEKEMKNINEQKDKLDRDRQSEEERLRKEKQATDDYIKRELEALEVAKESFTATMEHERSTISEKAESERSQLLHEFEMRKRKLETDMQIKLEDREKELRGKEKSFEEEKEKELSNINYLREVARREMDDLKMERLRVEKEKQEVDASKKHLEEQQIEIRKDVDDLVSLTKRLKDQREQFINERARFLSCVENNRNCKHCGQVALEFTFSDIEAVEIPNLSRLANDLAMEAPRRQMMDTSPTAAGTGSTARGGTVSWLRKCTSKILKLSPIKRPEMSDVQNLAEQGSQACEQANVKSRTSKMFDSAENQEERGVANDSFDVERVQSETGTREVEVSNGHSDDDQRNIDSRPQETAEDSLSDLNVDGRRRRRAKARVRRTRSVKAVVEDAKAILGKSQEFSEPEDSKADATDSAKMDDESRDEPGHRGKGAKRNGKKRTSADSFNTNSSKQDGNESDGKSDSVTGAAHQRGKRRQKAAADLQALAEPRYNLRRPRMGINVTRLSKENEEGGGTRGEDGVFCSKTTATAPIAVAVSGNGGGTQLIRCEAVAGSKNTDTGSPKRTADDEAVSEEVNGTPERAVSENEDDEEDESEHPGEVSIGKKLWTFFTT